jgi:hypothetical protein
MALTYTLRHRPTGTEEWTEVTGLTGTSHPVTGLTAGVRYDVEVVAVSSSGASSTPLATQRSTRCAAPTQPTVAPAGYALSSGDSGTNGALAASWSAVTGAVSYEVRTRPTGDGAYTAFGDRAAGTSRSVTGLDGTASYDLEVAAINIDGDVSAASTASTDVPARIASGGTVTTFDGNGTTGSTGTSYVVHTFTTSDTFLLNRDRTVDYLVVAGGGGGGAGGNSAGGGGGAGGLLQGQRTLGASESVAVIVGASGLGGVRGSTQQHGLGGGNSSFDGITATGGGGGRYGGSGEDADAAGGSGGGGAGANARTQKGVGTAGPPRQGHDGGSGLVGLTGTAAGGGGGAGGAGVAGTSNTGGNGGPGVDVRPFAPNLGVVGFLAGGGGGSSVLTQGSGRAGGGNGSRSGTAAAGAANTGSGGGGGQNENNGGDGGSGIVAVRYALPA